MKNLFVKFSLLSAITFALLSCSSDDDNATSDSVDQDVYGTWTADARVTNGTYNDVDECSELVKYRLRSNGTFEMTSYTGTDFDDCNENVQVSGQWDYLGDDNYLIYSNAEEAAAMADNASYTYHLEVQDSSSATQLKWTKLSDYTSGTETFVLFYD